MYRRQGQRGVYVQETGIGRGLCTGDRDMEGVMYTVRIGDRNRE